MEKEQQTCEMEERDGRSLRSDIIDHDLLCVTCEYNLRTLQPIGRCPECGTPVMRSLGRRPTNTGVRRGILTVMVLAALGPWVMPLVFGSQGTPDLVPTFFVSTLAELVGCAFWIVAGRRRTRHWRKRSATVIYFFVLILGLSVTAFHAWFLYVILYIAPNWG